MKLGKRLQHIESMVTSRYDHIWDACCDHGLLGAALLTKQVAPYIHFVDLVPELMQQLENKLTQFFPENAQSTLHADSRSQWQVHCIDASKLPLQEFSGKHLVIIAGVGGDLMSEFVQSIYEKNPAVEIDFLLCPVHHQFTLRQKLIQLNLNLLTEALIIENHRYYETILVSTNNTGSAVSPAGSLIWQAKSTEELKIANDYLDKTIAHYQRMQLKNPSEAKPIIDAYKSLTIFQD